MQSPESLSPYGPTEICARIQRTLRNLRRQMTDAPRQPASPVDTVFRTNQSLIPTMYNRHTRTHTPTNAHHPPPTTHNHPPPTTTTHRHPPPTTANHQRGAKKDARPPCVRTAMYYVSTRHNRTWRKGSACAVCCVLLCDVV